MLVICVFCSLHIFVTSKGQVLHLPSQEGDAPSLSAEHKHLTLTQRVRNNNYLCLLFPL